MPSQVTNQSTISQEKQLVKELTGLSSTDEIELNDTGWDSRVYNVNNERYFFKFPRSNKIKAGYKREIAALKLAGSLGSPIKIPKVIWEHTDNDYFGYEGVPGKALDSIVSELDADEKKVIGETLGKFLKQFHQLKLTEAKDMNVSDEVEQLHRWYQKALPVIQEAFSDNEQQKLHSLVYELLPVEMEKLRSEMKLCHGDLAGWNIIYNRGQIGIIDFGDISYRDPSIDMLDLGDSVITEVALEAYGADKLFKQRMSVRKLTPEIISLGFYAGKQNEMGMQKTIINIKNILDKSTLLW